jgi:hypothetical protein
MIARVGPEKRPRGSLQAYVDTRNDGWVSALPTIAKAAAPGDVWPLDFQFHSTMASKPFKILSTVDEHTRQALGGKVEYSITAEDPIDQLDVLVIERGMPRALRMDVTLGGGQVHYRFLVVAEQRQNVLLRNAQCRSSKSFLETPLRGGNNQS